jgi:hypothetical protein
VSGERAAIYSLLGSAKPNGLDPELYLHQMFERIADQPISRNPELSPWNLVVATPEDTPHSQGRSRPSAYLYRDLDAIFLITTIAL